MCKVKIGVNRNKRIKFLPWLAVKICKSARPQTITTDF